MRISDWSSDVCSSDLQRRREGADHHSPRLSGTIEPATDSIEKTELGVIRHLARYVLKAQPGCPTAEGTCHSPSGFRHTDFLVEGHSTTSLQRVSRSSATSSMVTPKPGPLGGQIGRASGREGVGQYG